MGKDTRGGWIHRGGTEWPLGYPDEQRTKNVRGSPKEGDVESKKWRKKDEKRQGKQEGHETTAPEGEKNWERGLSQLEKIMVKGSPDKNEPQWKDGWGKQ